MGLLSDHFSRHTYGILSTYRHDQIDAAVAAVSIEESDHLIVQFPGSHSFTKNQLVTVQLDDRMNVARFTAELPVHRTSYKGIIAEVDPGFVEVRPVQFQLFYSDRFVGQYQAPGYQCPEDHRIPVPLGPTQASNPTWRSADADTNLGVLFTRAIDRPHSTVMAFLSTDRGDIFLVTNPRTFKAHNLFRDPRVVFAVDYRATYDLAKPIDWAYRILPMKAFQIPANVPLHAEVTTAFLTKNPWNSGFFAAPGAVLLHLVPDTPH